MHRSSPRLKEILPSRSSVGFYSNGGACAFFLEGWAQEVPGDHAAAHGIGDTRAGELEPFLPQRTPEIKNTSLESSARQYGSRLTKSARVGSVGKKKTGHAANPIEKAPLLVLCPRDLLARWRRQMGEPDRSSVAFTETTFDTVRGPAH